MDTSGPAYRPVLVLGLLAGLLATGLLHLATAPRSQRLEPVAATTTALDVLHAWDDRRSTAYADGDVHALARLYVPGSTAAAADVRMLRSYLDKHLKVVSLRTQVFSVQVLVQRPAVLRLRVVDRIAGGSVMSPERCQLLPTDRARSRSIELRRVGEDWRVASVGW